jgi:hypothetical protein
MTSTSQTFNPQMYDPRIWLPPWVIPTDAPDQRQFPLSHEPKVFPRNISVLRNIPRYLPEVFHIDGTDLTAQVAQTCYRPVLYTLGNCISIIGSHKPDLVSPQIINMILNLVNVKQLR